MVGRQAVNQSIYAALSVLQHRGQDAAGIMTSDGKRSHLRKKNGLVKDVFQDKHMSELTGRIGIGHIRYPTAGSSSSAEAQPFYVNSPYGVSLAHNGNLTNADKLRDELYQQDRRHLNTNSDSEVLLNIFAQELLRAGALNVTPEQVFSAVSNVHKRVEGAYAAIAMITNIGIVGFRDPFGIRPMVYGKRETAEGVEWMVASESVALDLLGFELVDDVAPGEAIYIESNGHMWIQQCADKPVLSPCIFEHVYLARPDSIIDDISVYKSRVRMGEKLAKKILAEWPEHDIDVVMPIPDTSRAAAVELAHCLDVKYREGLVKNRYIGRTFIMPGQEQRQKSIREKLNALPLEFRGKNVLLVDDSIVRGNTSKQIIQMARDAGAAKVYMASAAPPVRFPNVYGIDMPAAVELVAHGRDEEEVRLEIGADRLFYQNLEDLVESVKVGNPGIGHFDTSCFTGKYVTNDVSDDYLASIAGHRSDSAKQDREKSSNTVIEMHNF